MCLAAPPCASSPVPELPWPGVHREREEVLGTRLQCRGLPVLLPKTAKSPRKAHRETGQDLGLSVPSCGLRPLSKPGSGPRAPVPVSGEEGVGDMVRAPACGLVGAAQDRPQGRREMEVFLGGRFSLPFPVIEEGNAVRLPGEAGGGHLTVGAGKAEDPTAGRAGDGRGSGGCSCHRAGLTRAQPMEPVPGRGWPRGGGLLPLCPLTSTDRHCLLRPPLSSWAPERAPGPPPPLEFCC